MRYQSRKNAVSSIKLAWKAFHNLGYNPRTLHYDCGVEYVNKSFKKFLENNSVIQSMTPKGNSLANRPSEYLFELIQREKFNKYKIHILNYEQVHKIVYEYFEYCNICRVQSNSKYKKPQAMFQAYGVCV